MEMWPDKVWCQDTGALAEWRCSRCVFTWDTSWKQGNLCSFWSPVWFLWCVVNHPCCFSFHVHPPQTFFVTHACCHSGWWVEKQHTRNLRLVSDGASKQASMPSVQGLPGAFIPNASISNSNTNTSGIWPHITMRILWAKLWLTCLPLPTVKQSHGCKL